MLLLQEEVACNILCLCSSSMLRLTGEAVLPEKGCSIAHHSERFGGYALSRTLELRSRVLRPFRWTRPDKSYTTEGIEKHQGELFFSRGGHNE